MSPESTPELPKTYIPSESESIVAQRWLDADAFAAPSEPDADQKTFSVVIPPPNVTAALHLGHALNNTLQDVLVRYHRMCGDSTLWIAGTDHAGIATQTVVEKRLLSDGIKRLDIGREKFVAHTQRWKDEYEAVIVAQLKEMGASCDWDRLRFTMDDMCATAVRHAFYTLYKDGLIYRGKRLVNWDPVTRTALADDEVEMEEVDGHMWYLKYPLAGQQGHVTVATTRPETMLGDTAVAVNPDDPNHKHLIGSNVLLPIVGRTIPIIGDDHVVMADPDGEVKAQYASGFLKVTPAHDPNDWDIGLRHDLDVINVMAADGSISASHGWDDVSDEAEPFVGLSREDARVKIVEWFDEQGLLAEVRDYTHSVGHSYRSHVPVEPWLSDQWYVAVTDDRLRGAALRAQAVDQALSMPEGVSERKESQAGDGALSFQPARYAQTYYKWHESIRDWCISRQLWWGHQIPIWSRIVGQQTLTTDLRDATAGSEQGETVPVTGTVWAKAGAVHTLRLLGDGEVEEVVCLPPEPTLKRVERDNTELDENALVALIEDEGFIRDPDVLDTWFSSALWPMSTMGWPWPQDYPETVGLLESYNPTSVLSTAREIITLWVSRMTMFNRYFLDGEVPFKDVFIHAMVQDGHGQKMSKSLGNGVDPRDIIHSHGADAMRFALVQMTTETQDVRMPVDMVCPYTNEPFTPEFVKSPAGYSVAAAIQKSPGDPSKEMVSAYGVSSGQVEASDDRPLARNTSSKFDLGRNFANKIWNATRFALGRVDSATGAAKPIDVDSLSFIDRWILSRLQQTVSQIDSDLSSYNFNGYAETVYDFVWHDVCDRFLEAVKPTVDDDPNQQVVLASVLDAVLRIMHPVCPHLTETLWPNVQQAQCGTIVGLDLEPSELLATARWPSIDPSLANPTTIEQFERSNELIGLIRSLRAERSVKPKQQVTLHLPEKVASLVDSTDGVVQTLAGVGTVSPAGEDTRPLVASTITFEGTEVLVSDLVEEIDVDAERSRLQKIAKAKQGQIKGFSAKLGNPGYLKGAPDKLVKETREMLALAEADLAATTSALEALPEP